MDWGFFEDHLVYEDGKWKNEDNKGCLRLAFFIRHSAGCVTVGMSAGRESSSM